MEDDSEHSPEMLNTARGIHERAPEGILFASWVDKFLERGKRLSFSICDAYLSILGIRDVRLPSITIAIPVAGEMQRLGKTVESLLSSRYRGLHISLIGLEGTAKIVETLTRHSSIKFFGAASGATIAEAIRPILLWAGSPIVAWLEPGDTLSPNALFRVGENFRRRHRVGCVLVPEKDTLASLSACHGTDLDFVFLMAQNLSFAAKIFVSREHFWAAAKIFAGTDYDCNDWAVALNTARFSKVQILSDESYMPDQKKEDALLEQSREVKAKITARMWWTERVRQLVWQRCVGAFDSIDTWGRQQKKKSEKLGKRVQVSVPPFFTDVLTGFSSGEAIEFVGTYRWLLATPVTRSVYFDRNTELLILQQPSQSNHHRNGSDVIDVELDSAQGRSAQAFADGVRNLLQGLSSSLRREPGDHVRASIFQMEKPVKVSERPASSAHSENQIPEPDSFFDLLVMEHSLNNSLRPHIVLRSAANHLKWRGWLILGCVAFDTLKLQTNWPESVLITQFRHELVFSKKALENLLRLAGFAPRHLLALTEAQVEAFSSKPSTSGNEFHALAREFFQAGSESSATEGFLLLACQRTF